MANIGIFFGTDTGKTRKIAKLIHKQLGEAAAAPVNINRATLADLLAYPALLLGTPTLGDGQLPGLEAGGESESWAEFIRNLGDVSLQGKTVALFGLGDQRGYPDNFASGLRPLYDALRARGATMIGSWPNEGMSSAPHRRWRGIALSGWCWTRITSSTRPTRGWRPGLRRLNRICCRRWRVACRLPAQPRLAR